MEQRYESKGGILREEAIMLLRRFYVQENDKGAYGKAEIQDAVILILEIAPEPRVKKNRVLKEEVLPIAESKVKNIITQGISFQEEIL